MVQLWAAVLLFKLLRNKNAHGYNTNMYMPIAPKKQVRVNGDAIWA